MLFISWFNEWLLELQLFSYHFKTVCPIWIAFLPHFDAQVELQRVVLVMSTCLNALSRCHVIGWLDFYFNAVKQMYLAK